ncbi:MAG: FAD-dependent oxidoreductase, partial [Deltaproteobacteria bacterium]|nr:FAD-dependent oxidoreductase [Deltaproteobacteria bacterium]
MNKFDAVIIGAGPGGYVCSIRMAQLGKKVLVVEKNKLGGECLNYGCIPSKALIFASHLYDKVKKADAFGVETRGLHFNIDKLQSFRSALISKLNQGIGFLLKQNKVEVLLGEAKFITPQKLSVQTASGVQEVEAGSFVLATGSSPT